MSKKLFSMISFVLLTALAGSALAADVQWTGAGPDDNWTTASNWNPPFVPIATDKAKLVTLPGPLISDGMAAVCQWLVIGDTANGELHMTGGTLNVSGTPDSWTIVAYAPSDVATFTMDGGTMTTSNRVYVGFQGNGTLNMNGGTINVGGTFGIGYGEGFTTGRGYVYLNGGTINASGTFTMSSPTGCIGTLDIYGGTLNLTGDKQAIVQGYIDNGWIIAYGGLGDVIMVYEGGVTTLTGVISPNKAKLPYPANNAVDVPPYVELTWVPGDTADAHDIYFGADGNNVNDANTTITLGVYMGQQPLDANYYDPCGLELGEIYYWRIDEVNEPNIYKGKVWHFTVADYSLVDDFEAYVDSNDLLLSWSNAGTGATLSLATSGGHDEAKTMKFDYDNSSDPNYSEAQTTDVDYDWAIAGVLAIDIWYKGDANNAAEQMYAALEDNNSNPVAVVVNSDPNVIKFSEWQVWRIKLADFAGVNLSNVKKFYLGFGDRNNPVVGGTGTVYFDDIRLHPTRCIDKPLEDLDDDCDVDFKDFAIMAQNWRGSSEI
jgi:hypothetical protein